MLLLLRFAMGDWKDQGPIVSAAPANRFLVAPLQRSTQQPVTVQRPTTKLR